MFNIIEGKNLKLKFFYFLFLKPVWYCVNVYFLK